MSCHEPLCAPGPVASFRGGGRVPPRGVDHHHRGVGAHALAGLLLDPALCPVHVDSALRAGRLCLARSHGRWSAWTSHLILWMVLIEITC